MSPTKNAKKGVSPFDDRFEDQISEEDTIPDQVISVNIGGEKKQIMARIDAEPEDIA